jgi:hypothetical protein
MIPRTADYMQSLLCRQWSTGTCLTGGDLEKEEHERREKTDHRSVHHLAITG